MTEDSASRPGSVAWGEHPLEAGEVRGWRFGPLRLWCRHADDELWIASERGEDEPAEEPVPPPPVTAVWSRWALGEHLSRVRFVPALPDRPVVVAPEFPFRVIRGAHAQIYARVPLWVRIQVPRLPGDALAELPTLVLSRTWFGALDEGELCYWLPTSARRTAEPQLFRPHLAVCALRVMNRSAGQLEVEKFALQVQHLSIFQLEGRFWADETLIVYEGEAEGTETEYTGRPPTAVAAGERVTGPRVPERREFRLRTFARLRSLSGFGILG
ncbi:MAG: hypothetical protein HY704_08940 [Gemmatimonadetes bacterium]|nr:hypothetical protein [Gemmatimonadota bacterium]